MAAAKTIRTKAGKATTPAKAGVVQVPLNTNDLLQAVDQLQRTVDELIVRHNALCDDTTHAADKVVGTAVTAQTVHATTP